MGVSCNHINKIKKMEALFVTKTTERSGEKDGKGWRVCNFLIETKGKYPKKVLLEGFNAIAEEVDTLEEGDEIEVLFEPEAKEYNGKWYNSIKCFKLELLKSKEKPKAKGKASKVADTEDNTDDLPF
jgi:hypothetical protein